MKNLNWANEVLEMLGEKSMNEISKLSGISRKSIARKMKKVGIPNFNTKYNNDYYENGILMKICSKCKSGFPKTNEYFYSNVSRWDGFSPYCRNCSKENMVKYFDREKYLTKRKGNRISKYQDEFINMSEQEFVSYMKRKRRENENIRKRKDRAENPERYKITSEKRRIYNVKHKTKYKKSYVYWSELEYDKTYTLFGHICGWCDKSEEQNNAETGNNSLDFDHFIPVKFNGKTIPGNVYPCCRECNRGIGGKFSKPPLEWAIEKFGEEVGTQKYLQIKSKLEKLYKEYINAK